MGSTVDFFIESYSSTSYFMIILEIIAFLFGIISVVYAKKENILVYPTGIICTVITVYILFKAQYFGDMMMNIYYSSMSIYGWWNWTRYKNDNTRIESILKNLNIFDKSNKKTNQLSQGEKQRVSIALAIVNSPKLILADEPTSSLDDNNCSKVIKLLKKQATDFGAQLIVITHDSRLKKHFKKSIEL